MMKTFLIIFLLIFLVSAAEASCWKTIRDIFEMFNLGKVEKTNGPKDVQLEIISPLLVPDEKSVRNVFVDSDNLKSVSRSRNASKDSVKRDEKRFNIAYDKLDAKIGRKGKTDLERAWNRFIAVEQADLDLAVERNNANYYYHQKANALAERMNRGEPKTPKLEAEIAALSKETNNLYELDIKANAMLQVKENMKWEITHLTLDEKILFQQKFQEKRKSVEAMLETYERSISMFEKMKNEKNTHEMEKNIYGAKVQISKIHILLQEFLSVEAILVESLKNQKKTEVFHKDVH